MDRLKQGATMALACLGGAAAVLLVQRMREILADARDSSPRPSRSLARPEDAVGAAAGYRGKVVLITGSSSGIGATLALRLARYGARLALHYSARQEAIEAIAAECTRLGAQEVHIFRTDLSVEAEHASAALVDAVLRTFGRIDVAVLNAGIAEKCVVDDLSEEGPSLGDFMRIWRKTLELNLTAAAALTYCVSRHMVRRAKEAGADPAYGAAVTEGVGAIVSVGSRGAFRGEPHAWAYGCSKAGMHHLMQSSARALGQWGIVCTAVAPGFVATPMTEKTLRGPAGEAIAAQSSWNRVATPEEVASCVEFAGAFWEHPWISGAILDCNGASYLRS